MKRKMNFLSRTTALLLTVCLLLSLCACGKTETEEPEETESTVPQQTFELSDTPVYKEESVYINLNPDGSVTGTTVTDHLHTELPQVRIEDVTNLTDISDVKTFIEPVYENGTMYWDMEGTDLYYSGSTTAEAPISIEIKYYLDGEEIDYNDLAGKSGNVRMEIKAENRLTKPGTFGTVTCPMLFVGGMILPEEDFKNLKTDNAAVIGDGSHKLVFFVGIPGMSESLALESLPTQLFGDGLTKTEYAVSADVESFSVSNMMFAALPLSSVFSLAGEDAVAGIEGLQSALGSIEGLLNSFAELDVTQLMQLLYGGASQAETLVSALGEVSELYSENKELLELLEEYVTEENIELARRLVTELESVDPDDLSTVLGSEEFAGLLKLLSSLDYDMNELADISNDAALLMETVNDLNAKLQDEDIQKSLDKLPETVARLKALTALMEDSRETLDSIQELLGGDTLDSLMSLAQSCDLSALSQVQAEHLARRMQDWLAFGQEYDIFTCRTETASSSVIFIYKTAAIG